jgi:hypothetical protein
MFEPYIVALAQGKQRRKTGRAAQQKEEEGETR